MWFLLWFISAETYGAEEVLRLRLIQLKCELSMKPSSYFVDLAMSDFLLYVTKIGQVGVA